jgi:hypothetical protein
VLDEQAVPANASTRTVEGKKRLDLMRSFAFGILPPESASLARAAHDANSQGVVATSAVAGAPDFHPG